MRIITIVSALLCLLFCACAPQEQEQSSGQAYYQVVTEAPTETEDPTPDGTEAYVKTAREETFETGDGDPVTYSIPRLTADSSDAKAINSAIEKEYAKDFETAAKENGQNKALSVSGLGYECFINDEVLSIVVTRTTSGHNVSYSVYNYDIEKNKRLDNSGIAAYMDRDESAVYAAVETALQSDYVSKFKFDNFKDDYYINYENTLSDDNIKNCSLFFDGSGSLCAICKEFASVGAGEFNVKIKVVVE